MEDTGVSISPEVDVGQVEGGFVMGLGLWTSEKLSYDEQTGQLLENSTWSYHPPSCMDIPADLRTEFYNSGNNPHGVLSSKATGEPSVLAGCSVLFALRMAISSARKDGGDTDWFQFGKICLCNSQVNFINIFFRRSGHSGEYQAGYQRSQSEICIVILIHSYTVTLHCTKNCTKCLINIFPQLYLQYFIVSSSTSTTEAACLYLAIFIWVLSTQVLVVLSQERRDARQERET